jgi:hypothetical protein
MAAPRLSGALLAIVLGGVATFVGAAPVSAVGPVDLLDEDAARLSWPPIHEPGPIVEPPPTATPRPIPTATPTPSPLPSAEPVPEFGLDVSYPQCGDELPDAFGFAVVGVNGGRVHSANPCLGATGDAASQLAWAGRDAELYANTGNPGPRLSRHWPGGQGEPRACRDEGLLSGTDTRDCAYLYGWNAAADSYRTALEAFTSVGWADADADALPWATTWWLDVETANSWRFDRRLNVATLEGARDYLMSRDVAEVGFYSTPQMWGRITGGATEFDDHPAWHAGARDMEDARERCDEAAFTGGELVMVQWVEDGLDHNLRCRDG